jgi:hypothetical protein
LFRLWFGLTAVGFSVFFVSFACVLVLLSFGFLDFFLLLHFGFSAFLAAAATGAFASSISSFQNTVVFFKWDLGGYNLVLIFTETMLYFEDPDTPDIFLQRF